VQPRENETRLTDSGKRGRSSHKAEQETIITTIATTIVLRKIANPPRAI